MPTRAPSSDSDPRKMGKSPKTARPTVACPAPRSPASPNISPLASWNEIGPTAPPPPDRPPKARRPARARAASGKGWIADHRRSVDQVARIRVGYAFGRDAATIAQHRDPIGDPEDFVETVRNVDNSDATFSHPSRHAEQAGDVGLWQRGARFVEYEQVAVYRDGAGNRDDGFLRGGKVAHAGVRVDLAAHSSDSRGRGRTCSRPGNQSAPSWVARNHGDVLRDGHLVYQSEILMDERDRQVIDDGIDSAPSHSNFAVVRTVYAGQDFDQRKFAGPILAQQRMHFAGTRLKSDLVESDVAGEALRQPITSSSVRDSPFTEPHFASRRE